MAVKDRVSLRDEDTEIERPSRIQESRESEEIHPEWEENWNPGLACSIQAITRPALDSFSGGSERI